MSKVIPFAGLVVFAMLTFTGCAKERIDFDRYLNVGVGKPLSGTEYEERLGRVNAKKMIFETEDFYTYRYWLQGSLCTWDVDVDKRSSIVLRWRYVTVEAGDACRDLPARRGV